MRSQIKSTHFFFQILRDTDVDSSSGKENEIPANGSENLDGAGKVFQLHFVFAALFLREKLLLAF